MSGSHVGEMSTILPKFVKEREGKTEKKANETW